MAFASRSVWVASLALTALSLPACGDDSVDGEGGSGATTATTTTATSTGTGECAGVVEDGQCVGKCDPATCAAGNTCVANRCALACEGAADCYPGSSCAEVTDDSGAAITACQPSGKSPILGTSCAFGNECEGSTVCPDGTACGASLCGGQACANNLCPDGTACVPQTCDATACRAPRCLGAVEGAENSPNAESFCTQDDCTADSDCAQGLYCGKTRDFHEVCGEEVELADPGVGPCIDPADFDKDGMTYELGSVTLLRNTCLVRRQCAPCTDDFDCSADAGQLCASLGDEQRCATTCVTDGDCERDAACLEDPAHAGVLVCTPRFGSCTGDGGFCEPCLNDTDCGGPETSLLCGQTAGKQRACFDVTLPDECETDDDCPLSPDGVSHGECLDGGEQYTSADPEYHHCYFPYFSDSNRFQCW